MRQNKAMNETDILDCKGKEIMSDNNHDLWRYLKQGVLKACNEICGYKKNRQCNVNMWYWNSWVKGAIQRKKAAYKAMINNPTEETKSEYRRLNKAAKETVV